MNAPNIGVRLRLKGAAPGHAPGHAPRTLWDKDGPAATGLCLFCIFHLAHLARPSPLRASFVFCFFSFSFFHFHRLGSVPRPPSTAPRTLSAPAKMVLYDVTGAARRDGLRRAWHPSGQCLVGGGIDEPSAAPIPSWSRTHHAAPSVLYARRLVGPSGIRCTVLTDEGSSRIQNGGHVAGCSTTRDDQRLPSSRVPERQSASRISEPPRLAPLCLCASVPVSAALAA